MKMTVKELADSYGLSKSGIRLYLERIPQENRSYEQRSGKSVIVIDEAGQGILAALITAKKPENHRTLGRSVEHTAHIGQSDCTLLKHSEEMCDDGCTLMNTENRECADCATDCTPKTIAHYELSTAQAAITALTDQITAKDQQIAAKDNQIAELQAALATAQRTISTQTDAISRMVDYQHQLEAAAQDQHMKYRRGFMLFGKRRKSDD